MFDDQLSPSNTPPNLPVEPDDIFASTEKDGPDEMPAVPNALDAGLLKKKDSSSAAPAAANVATPFTAGQNLYEMKQPILGRILMFMLVAIILGGVGFGGWYVYSKFLTPQSQTLAVQTSKPVATQLEPQVQKPAEVVAPIENIMVTTTVSTTAEVTNGMNNDKILFGQTVDSDHDGLDDIREKELGTDPNKADADGDGLNDGDEILIWKTDPLNPDTDGDGYKDGEEVSHGYNPLGTGKLFNPQFSSSTTSSASISTTSVKK